MFLDNSLYVYTICWRPKGMDATPLSYFDIYCSVYRQQFVCDACSTKYFQISNMWFPRHEIQTTYFLSTKFPIASSKNLVCFSAYSIDLCSNIEARPTVSIIISQRRLVHLSDSKTRLLLFYTEHVSTESQTRPKRPYLLESSPTTGTQQNRFF
ncbi:hypothetical protein Droror1_Dr00027243 [Drosera rotundifolia]